MAETCPVAFGLGRQTTIHEREVDYLGAIERALVVKIGVESISRSRGNMVTA
jgi:hypothetical protein